MLSWYPSHDMYIDRDDDSCTIAQLYPQVQSLQLIYGQSTVETPHANAHNANLFTVMKIVVPVTQYKVV